MERLSSQRENEIAALAEDLAVSRFQGERVQPEEIATAEGLAFRYASFPEEFDGILLHEHGRFFVVCNERRGVRGTARSRFTFAHELGHYFLDDHRLSLASGKIPAHFSLAEFASDQPIEAEADCFAANLLMPAKSFRRKAAELNPGLALICALASTFGTSVTSTAYRAMELDVFPAPCAMFRWTGQGAPKRSASLTTRAMFGGYRVMTDSAPPGSATAQCLADGSTGIIKQTTDCSQWFPAVPSGSPRNVILREEVMQLGRFGWLSLVFRST